MILDCSLAGRLRMRSQAIADLDAWLAQVELPTETESVEFIGRESEGAFRVRVKRTDRKRVGFAAVREYPPRSLWWYMSEGEAK